jgi:hypothetical protein
MLIESIERMLPMQVLHHLISFHPGQNGSHRNCIDVSITIDICADRKCFLRRCEIDRFGFRVRYSIGVQLRRHLAVDDGIVFSNGSP